jgi:hypothetical protein
MMRPLEKYPINHHYAQIIERVQDSAALQCSRGSRFVTLEGAMLNGDEPATPFDAPRWARVGDSWSARATVQIATGVQFSGSHAYVRSPEIQQGGAFDHAQHHASIRVERPIAAGERRYLLGDWARTDEIMLRHTAFRYPSTLIEGAYGWHAAKPAYGFQAGGFLRARNDMSDTAMSTENFKRGAHHGH